MREEVVVTGMGVLSAVGEGLTAFAAALEEGRCGMAADDAGGLPVAARLSSRTFEARLAGLALPADVADRARKAARSAPRAVQVSLVAALEAWVGSGLAGATVAPEAINLMVAGHNISPGHQQAVAEKYKATPEYIPARHALQFMDTDHVGVISEVLALRGEGCTVGGASASGNVGLLHACRQVQAGLCQACIVVGPMADLSPVETHALRNLGAMGGRRFAAEPEKACRPFDRDREGFILGEGSACLILERADAARERQAAVWGRIAGGAMCLDGNRLADPSVDGEIRAMRNALRAADLAPESVNYVNAHGTSSLLGDEVEAKALREVFGAGLARVWVNATKGLTGHCLYSAALVEAVAVLVQLKRGFLHPNRNLEHPLDPAIRFVGAASRPERCDVALSNAFGFGGINTCVAFTR